MPTIDLSRLSSSDYLALVERWKSSAKTPYKRGSISVDEVDLTLGAESETLIIEFHLLAKDHTLEIVMRGFDAGHRVTWTMPMNDVPSDSSIAYERFVRQAEETLEHGFARRHKRFFLEEWKHFNDSVSG